MMMSPRLSAPVPPDVIARLKTAAEPSGYLEDPSEIAAYCRSWRDDWTGKVPLVLRPKTTQQVAEIVRVCASAGVAIVPQGGNTGLTGAGQPHERGRAPPLRNAAHNSPAEHRCDRVRLCGVIP